MLRKQFPLVVAFRLSHSPLLHQQDSHHSSRRHQNFFSDILVRFFRNWTGNFFVLWNPLRIWVPFLRSVHLQEPIPGLKTGKKLKISEIGQLWSDVVTMFDLKFFGKIWRETCDCKKIKKTGQKSGLEIRRRSGLTPMARSSSGAGAPPIAARPKWGLQSPWDLLQNSLFLICRYLPRFTPPPSSWRTQKTCRM